MSTPGVVLALAIAVLAAVLLMVPGKPPALEQAPDFTLRSLDGEDVSVADFRGHVVILDFWASWCAPCTRTFASLHAIANGMKESGVVLLVVSLDKSAAAAREAMTVAGYATNHVLYGSLKEAREVKSLYGVGGIPHTFVIDRSGRIRYSGLPTGVTEERLQAWL